MDREAAEVFRQEAPEDPEDFQFLRAAEAVFHLGDTEETAPQ